MLLSPTAKLLWITFWLAVPALTLAGVSTSALPFVAVWLVLFASVLTLDAHRLHRLLTNVAVSLLPAVPAYKDRPSWISVSVQLPVALHGIQLALGLPAGFRVEEPAVLAASSSTFKIAFTPLTRGEFSIQSVFLWSSSPWRLWNIRLVRPVDQTIRVFPNLSQDPASRILFSTFQQGQRVRRVVGRGREVERLREYAPGDSFDEVYWKGTARRGSPITKVFQVERTQDIYAIVDGSRLGNRNQALERFVSASLMLALAAEKNADNFGLLTFTDRVHHFVRASHDKGHFQRCREAIFDLQPSIVSPDFNELFTFINLRIRKRALLFFLTDLSDPMLAETFLRDASLVARRHVVIVDQIADSGDRPLFTGTLPDNESEVQMRLAGHLQWLKLRELEKGLSHKGINMHLLKPDQASSELIGQYMTVKQRQML